MENEKRKKAINPILPLSTTLTNLRSLPFSPSKICTILSLSLSLSLSLFHHSSSACLRLKQPNLINPSSPFPNSEDTPTSPSSSSSCPPSAASSAKLRRRSPPLRLLPSPARKAEQGRGKILPPPSMWRPWAKSTVKARGPPSSPSSSSSSASGIFSCTTFKDVQALCAEPSSPFLSPRRRPILLRPTFAATYSLLRSSSVPLPGAEPEPDPAKAQPAHPSPPVPIPGADDNLIVVYFTSLRVVRPTFEDCKSVRSILRGFRVRMDERDLSMDSSFLAELQAILGGGGQPGKLALPRVFIRGRYVGGAKEILQLHEIGELKKLVEGVPAAEPGVCDACGGYRFVLCGDCDGSHKLYTEKTGFRSCPVCNENGLVKCPSCTSAPL